MNTQTGEIKPWDKLTEEEKKSPFWRKLNGLEGVVVPQYKPMSKSDLKREAYMEKVKQKKKEGQNV